MNSRGKAVLAVVLLFFFLSWIAVSLRIYTKRVVINAWGKDDWAMVFALMFFTIFSALQGTAAVYGTGQHRWDLSDDDARTALLCTYLCELAYVLANCCLKIALGIFYLRFAVHRWHVFIIKNVMGGTVLFGLAYFFLAIFQCIPASEFWNNTPLSEKCFPPSTVVDVTYALSAANAFADWTLGILPIFIIRTMQMKRKNKILVSGILAFASIGNTATLVRMKYARSLEDPDWLYATSDWAIWSTIEPGIGITAASVATLRPLLHKALWRIGLASSPSSGQRRFGASYNSDESDRKHTYRRQRDPVLPELVPLSHGVTSTTISGPLTPKSFMKPSLPTFMGTVELESLDEEFGRGMHRDFDVEQAIARPPRVELRGSEGDCSLSDSIFSKKPSVGSAT